MPTRSAILAACLLFLPSAAFSEEYHTRPNCWEEPRIYSSVDLRPGVTIERASGSLTKAVLSPNGAYGFVLREIAGDGENPPGAVLDISIERPYLLRLELPDIHAVGPPGWIAEKLLYLRVWWGRVAGTDYLIDVENEEIIVRDGFRFGTNAYLQFQQCKNPEWKDSPTCACFSGAPQGWQAQPLTEASSQE